jgi:hypothetical protein
MSIADVARHAIERELPEPASPGALSFFAVGAGGPANAAEHAEDFVGEAIERRHSSS